MNQLDLAIHRTAHDCAIGLPRLAKMMGVNEQTLRNKVCPTSDSHKLSVQEALSMMLITGDASIIEVQAAELDLEVVSSKPPAPMDMLGAVLSAAGEFGRVNQSIHDAMLDGRISQRELADIIDHIGEARAALLVIEQSARALCGLTVRTA